MIIKEAKYIKGATKNSDFPKDELKEFLFCGRSNVGKSSLINMLLGRKNLAYTSSKPGKTQVINFFLINNSCYFVDIPGYGYANKNKNLIKDFGDMFDEYIKNRKNLKIAFLLVDSQIGATDNDIIMFNYLKSFNKKIIVIATKKDKLNQSSLYHSKILIKNQLNLNDDEIIYTSSSKSYGKDKILDLIEQS